MGSNHCRSVPATEVLDLPVLVSVMALSDPVVCVCVCVCVCVLGGIASPLQC